jgi:hypothetical protein
MGTTFTEGSSIYGWWFIDRVSSQFVYFVSPENLQDFHTKDWRPS